VKRGLFLSFEGGEGSGKSLQARGLAQTLIERGRDVVLTREPGGTAAGERIRDILLHAREIPLSPEAQVLLFSSARAQLVREVIRPALDAGKIVIADRFFDSSVVYQGHGQGVPLEAIREVTRLAVEADATDLHVRVRDAYLRLAAAEPRRFVVIPADREEAEVASDIRREVDTLLGAPA